MSLQVNKVTIAGNLTRDPQVRFLANENAVAQLGVATNRRWKDKDGNLKEEATFVDCEAWGRTAELIGQHFTKGSAIYLEGRLKLDSWEKDGQKHYKLKVIVDEVKFVESKRDGAPAATGSSAGTTADASSSNEPKPAPRPAGNTAAGHDEPPF